MSERDQRTQEATPQRLKKAREEGKYPASKEFVAGVQFAVTPRGLRATTLLDLNSRKELQ